MINKLDEGKVLDLAKKVVSESLKQGYDDVAAIVNYRNEVMVKFANSQPSIMQNWNIIGISVYLAKDKRVATLDFEVSNEEEALRYIRNYISEISLSEPSEYYTPLPQVETKIKRIEEAHESIVKALENPEEISEEILNTALTYDIDKLAGMFNVTVGLEALSTSTGVETLESYGNYEFYVRVFKDEGSGQWASAGRILRRESIVEATKIAVGYALNSKRRESIAADVYDIVLSPMVVANLFNIVGSMASAFRVDLGLSIFANNKVGDRVASEKLTLIDDPRNPESYSMTFVDAEGIPTRRNSIIENGVLKTFLHNSKTARRHGVESTGNAGWINPHPWSLEVAPGNLSLDELIAEVKRGILVTNNWYTRLQNYVEGMFSTVTRDALFLIENGKIVKAVTKLRIADKLPRILRNIEYLGKRRYQIKWWEAEIPTITPYILVRNVHTSKHLL